MVPVLSSGITNLTIFFLLTLLSVNQLKKNANRIFMLIFYLYVLCLNLLLKANSHMWYSKKYVVF